jgi:hypothetical protein
MKTRDFDIRKRIHEKLRREFEEDTVIVDELEVCLGEARIDIAAVNGALHGYEIKSDSDTLKRLPRQIDIYSKVFDKITIITGNYHVEKISYLVPEWWGILEADAVDDEVIFKVRRKPQPNPSIDAYALVQLLWRDEALQILIERGLDRGVRSKRKWDIWDRIVNMIETNELKACVRECLKKRYAGQVD